MTYLDTLDNAGTEFYHQKLTTPCEKGLTLIWPAGWTHMHRGVTNTVGDKSIITGWYTFQYTEEQYKNIQDANHRHGILHEFINKYFYTQRKYPECKSNKKQFRISLGIGSSIVSIYES